MMHGKAIEKLGIGEIVKVSKDNAIRVERGRGVKHLIWTPAPCKKQTCWCTLGYGLLP